MDRMWLAPKVRPIWPQPSPSLVSTVDGDAVILLSLMWARPSGVDDTTPNHWLDTSAARDFHGDRGTLGCTPLLGRPSVRADAKTRAPAVRKAVRFAGEEVRRIYRIGRTLAAGPAGAGTASALRHECSPDGVLRTGCSCSRFNAHDGNAERSPRSGALEPSRQNWLTLGA